MTDMATINRVVLFPNNRWKYHRLFRKWKICAMKHKVKVNLITRQKKKEELLSNRTLKLPKRIITALLGDAT